ncbi:MULTISPECIES: porin [unclassified Paraburkholderia]|uniref:porin n=1 Tax=unclassified Paraburkholderia TaxID=2615204 RepID=UPI002AAF47F8|nr:MULTISPECIES: porin [unclassified Paraburkholderia]
MKLRLAFLYTFGLFSAQAQAQSSVTLYGVVDVGGVYSSNAWGKQQYALASGVEGSSVWGLKGSENLGGGAKAIFTLENGYSSTTGAISQNGTFFGRQAFVGLSGTPGTVTLGRQYSSAYWYTGYLSAGGSWAAAGAGYGAHPGDVDNLDTFARVNNTIKYTTPVIGGLSASAMYSFGGQAGSTATNRIIAFGAGYVRGPLTLGVAYQDTNRPNFSLYGNKANDSATANNMVSAVNLGFASAAAQKIFAAAAAYTLGNATFGAVFSNTRYTDLGSVAVTGLSKKEAAYRGVESFNIGELNVKYQLTPVLMLGVAYDYTNCSGPTRARYQQIDMGVDYSISKTTDLYTLAFYQHASGTDSRGLPAVAAIAGATWSKTNVQVIATVGIRHKF